MSSARRSARRSEPPSRRDVTDRVREGPRRRAGRRDWLSRKRATGRSASHVPGLVRACRSCLCRASYRPTDAALSRFVKSATAVGVRAEFRLATIAELATVVGRCNRTRPRYASWWPAGQRAAPTRTARIPPRRAGCEVPLLEPRLGEHFAVPLGSPWPWVRHSVLADVPALAA